MHPDNMQPELQASAFGIAKNINTISMEKGRCPTLRVQHRGTKLLVAAKNSEIREFMASKGVTGINPDTTTSFFKSLSREVIDNYLADGFQLFSCTVPAGDACLLPFDWLFAEQITKDCDVFGAKMCFWLRSDLDEIEKTSKWLVSTKRPNSLLTSAYEVMLAAEAATADEL